MLEKITGINAVLETLRADKRKIEKIYIIQGVRKGKLKEIEDRALFSQIPIEQIATMRLGRLCGHDQHQGVMAMVHPFHFIELKDLLNVSVERKSPPFLLVIDQIQDPRNFGAVIRTAEGAGVDGIIITTRRTSPLSPTVVKASAGASEHMKIVKVVNLVNTLDYLKSLGIWIVGTTPNAKQSVYDLDGTDAIALVVGSEGKGLRPLVARTCDWLISIPMSGIVQSLNVSNSAAVVLYEIYRQRIKNVEGKKTVDQGIDNYKPANRPGIK